MNQLGKGFSTYRVQDIEVPQFHEWLEIIQRYSKKYEKFRGFLPEQLKLLSQIHSALSNKDARVVCFTAPPSSGKTHVIALCAVYLSGMGLQVCVVTPNIELRLEFQSELQEVQNKSKLPVILTIASYMRRRGEFDYALFDEAHNLRSAIELDVNIVRTIQLKRDQAKILIRGIFRTQGEKVVSKELNLEVAHDVLQNLLGGENDWEARNILNTLSEWRCFCTATRSSSELRFIVADPDQRNIVPKGRLFLFSATLLELDELEFFCNIPKRIIQPPIGRIPEFTPKGTVAYGYIEVANDVGKMVLAAELLGNQHVQSMILINRDSVCKTWGNVMVKTLGRRVLVIRSGLSHHKRNLLFRKYSAIDDGVLVTSSNVFWEGITIKGLRFLIIPNPPFPRPTIIESMGHGHLSLHRMMKRRLIQGMGRIGRVCGSRGVCLLLFKPTILSYKLEKVSLERAASLLDDLGD